MLHLTIILPNLCNCECNTGLLETTLRSKIADAGLVSTVFISAARKQRKISQVFTPTMTPNR